MIVTCTPFGPVWPRSIQHKLLVLLEFEKYWNWWLWCIFLYFKEVRMTVMNIQKELIIQFIMKYVNCISLWIYLVRVKPRAILLWIDCVFFFKISNEYLLQTSKREQGKLASNTPSLVILNDIVTFKLNEIKFCQAKMPSIKFFLVIQILFLFSGAIWN